MTNDDIIQMLRAGYAEDMIMAAMLVRPAQFDTSVRALLELQRAGASDRVLNTLLDPNSAEGSTSFGHRA